MILADHAAIYARPPTGTENGEAVSSQVERLDAYARQQGLRIADQHYYNDRQSDGVHAYASDTFYAMMKAALRGEFAVIFVTTLSRLTRDKSTLEVILKDLKDANVELVTIDDGVTVVTRDEQSEQEPQQAHLAFEEAAAYIQRFIHVRFRRWGTQKPGPQSND